MATSSALVFALPGNQVFAERLALAVEAEMGELSLRDFPDGETYLRLETDPAERDVWVIGTLARPNERILPLLFATGTARQLGASRVGIVAPYLAYMRQDASFHPGEAVTARLFAGLISDATDCLLTIEPHLHRLASLNEIYAIPATAVHVTEIIGAWVAANVSRPLIVGPDEESKQWASGVAAAAAAPHVVLSKVRRGDADVVATLPDLSSHRGRTPVLVDDIISTGHTMIAAIQLMRQGEPGLPAPVCIGVHAVFAAGAYEQIRNAGAARVVTTNSVPHPSNGIDVVPAIAAELRRRAMPCFASRTAPPVPRRLGQGSAEHPRP